MPDLPDGYVEARWVPIWGALTPFGVVEHGDVLAIPAGEAKESDHWAVVKQTAPASAPSADKPKGDS